MIKRALLTATDTMAGWALGIFVVALVVLQNSEYEAAGRVFDQARAQLNAQLKDMPKMQADYVTRQMNDCLATQASLKIGFLDWFYENRQSAASQMSLDQCVREFVLSAGTLTELTERNQLLEGAGIAPFSEAQMLSLVQGGAVPSTSTF